DGANERYSEEGKLLSKSVYKDGKQISVQTWYENGQKEEEKHFDEQGQLNGLVKQWYKNGNLAKSQNYKHDILDGNSEEWYENGIPESLYPYKNGKTDGIAKSWNKYGKLTYSIEYKNGVENGAYRNWSKNTGKLTKETLYVNGIRQGVEKEFNDRTGKLLTSTQYVNNKRHGTEETYDQNGIKYITCYQNDQKLSSLDNPTQIKDNATTGDSSAQFALGKYEFICANIDEGIKWLTKSAEQKNTDAIYFLATAYKGNGIPANNEKYLAYLQQAATLGSSNAQAEIGYLYLIGKELPQNLPDAGVWFKKAAAQGNFAAHFYLGRMYQNGDGVERNMEKARFHLSNAAEGGIEPALKALNELEHQTK
ncbi:sel1 repeat family protein, partial [Shigella flexneri K-304]